jgi:hypothetical protein
MFQTLTFEVIYAILGDFLYFYFLENPSKFYGTVLRRGWSCNIFSRSLTIETNDTRYELHLCPAVGNAESLTGGVQHPVTMEGPLHVYITRRGYVTYMKSYWQALH